MSDYVIMSRKSKMRESPQIVSNPNMEATQKKKGDAVDYLMQFEALRPDRIAKLQEIFNFVTQGSGVIKTPSEFGVIARSFGAQVTDEELEEIVSELSASGGGTIDFLDFCGLMTRQYNDSRDAEFTDAFNSIDVDGDGMLTPEELQAAFAALNYQFSDVEIREMCSEADADGDGKLTLKDFMFNCKSS